MSLKEPPLTTLRRIERKLDALLSKLRIEPEEEPEEDALERLASGDTSGVLKENNTRRKHHEKENRTERERKGI